MTIKNKVQELAIYQAKNGAIELKPDFDKETFWLSKKQIADIFNIDRSVVLKHIKSIFQDKELDQKLVCANFAHTTKHGSITGKTQTRLLKYYNLDIVLAVGYRAKSSLAVEFRKWATKILKQHITQGFTINKNIIDKNCQEFLKAVEDIKLLTNINPGSILLTIVIQLYYYIDIIINSKNMRQVLSLSLPQQTTIEIKKSAKQRGFTSVSGYIKYLFDLDQDLISETELLNSIKSARQEYKEGRAIKAKSLIDLV